MISKGFPEFEALYIPSYVQLESQDDDAWLEDSVQDILQSTARTGREPDWSRLAAGLGVTYRKMMSVVQRVKGQ
jgi:hypothetical protein